MAMMVGLMCSMPGLSAQAEEAAGVWMMDSGKVTVRIADCGASLCGTIVALKKPLDKKGRPKLDKENPNPALRGRRVIGLTILSNMKPTGENSWKGTIYNPDDGNTYSSRMMLKGANAMRVEGCVASLFCKTIKFTRIK
jgi:uncharacterized protein (DUF2147 family)